MTKLAPGVEVEAYCGKCRLVRLHVIVAMKGTRAAKTECRTCGSVHAYRKNPPGTRAAAGTGSSGRRTKYDQAIEGRDLSNAIHYSVSQKFKEQDLLEHDTFGIGVVTRIVTANKMEVLFPESTKLLIFSR